MPPKYEADEDDDAPPCSIREDIMVVERWEQYKNKKYGNKRKAPCSCRYFKGIIPSTHICFIAKNNVGCFSWFLSLFYK